MSTTENDIFLEHVNDCWESGGFTPAPRNDDEAAMIANYEKQMGICSVCHHSTVVRCIERVRRKQWLHDFGMTEGDLLFDDRGAFIVDYQESERDDAGHMQGGQKKIRVPNFETEQVYADESRLPKCRKLWNPDDADNYGPPL